MVSLGKLRPKPPTTGELARQTHPLLNFLHAGPSTTVKSTIVCKFVVESLSLPVFLSRFSQEALLAGQVNEDLSLFL